MEMTALLIPPLVLASFVVPYLANADIYHYIDSEGVACFTDTPTTSEAVVIIKEKSNRIQRSTQKTVPYHLSATGIDKKMGRDDNSSSSEHQNFYLPIKGRITSLSGLRHDPIDGMMRIHNGVDIAAPSGTPIKPALPGTVVFSGTRPGYGNMVILEHNNGTITLYAHNLLNIKSEGEYADAGDTIALLGSTGRSTGPHLHFEAWKDGTNITSSFTGTATTGGTSGDGSDTIRMSVSPDGSLRFTNLN